MGGSRFEIKGLRSSRGLTMLGSTPFDIDIISWFKLNIKNLNEYSVPIKILNYVTFYALSDLGNKILIVKLTLPISSE